MLTVPGVPGCVVRPACEADVPHLGAIELAAARLLADHAPPEVLAEVDGEDDFRAAIARGHLWVAAIDDAPVGLAVVTLLAPGQPHLEEVDVHPGHGRRGIGAALVRAVCEWARAAGHSAVTLTTFRAPRFNAPFYARLGFVPLADDELTPALRAQVADEAARGLDPAARVVMRAVLAAPR